jgi:hypothetical protein
MKARAIIVENQQEIDHARMLNIKEPVMEFGTVDLYFSLHAISSAFVTRDNFLKTIIAENHYFLENDEQIRIKILNHLETF